MTLAQYAVEALLVSRGLPAYVLAFVLLCTLTKGWLGRLELGGWLHTEMVCSPEDGSPIPVQSGLDVE